MRKTWCACISKSRCNHQHGLKPLDFRDAHFYSNILFDLNPSFLFNMFSITQTSHYNAHLCHVLPYATVILHEILPKLLVTYTSTTGQDLQLIHTSCSILALSKSYSQINEQTFQNPCLNPSIASVPILKILSPIAEHLTPHDSCWIWCSLTISFPERDVKMLWYKEK